MKNSNWESNLSTILEFLVLTITIAKKTLSYAFIEDLVTIIPITRLISNEVQLKIPDMLVNAYLASKGIKQ